MRSLFFRPRLVRRIPSGGPVKAASCGCEQPPRFRLLRFLTDVLNDVPPPEVRRGRGHRRRPLRRGGGRRGTSSLKDGMRGFLMTPASRGAGRSHSDAPRSGGSSGVGPVVRKRPPRRPADALRVHGVLRRPSSDALESRAVISEERPARVCFFTNSRFPVI